MLKVVSVGLVVFAAALLTGCGASGAASREKASTTGATTSPAIRDFQVSLKEVNATCRRTFGTVSDSYNRSPGNSLGVSIALTDMVGGRLYRVRDVSTVSSITDGRGRELLEKGEGSLKTAGGGNRAEFVPVTDQRANPTIVMGTSIGINGVVESITRIAGEVAIDLITDDVDRVVPLPAVGEAIEIAPGITAVIKLLDAEVEAAPNTMWMGRASVEVRSPAPTAGRPGPVVQTVELLDGSGAALSTLVRREESTIGPTLRRRFSSEGGYGNSRTTSEKASAARSPKSLRVRVLTGVEVVSVPFEFGPIQWNAPAK